LSINLRKLDYSPTVNPLVEPQELHTKNRLVRSGTRAKQLTDENGEQIAVSIIFTTEQKDDAEFVKIFAAGVAASYDLTKTAQRVFQVVLDQYERTPMKGGYADAIDLFWFGEGIEGRDIGMSEKTFQRGLKEMLTKRFIAPKTPTSYWVNPALFFKGDRVQFVREYTRRRQNNETTRRMQASVGITHKHLDLADVVDQAEHEFMDNATQKITTQP
jgi:hypothetical protein